MTAQTALFLAGLLQIGGIVVTFCGAVRTWNTFSPNERILDSTRTRIGRVSATIHRRIKHHHRTETLRSLRILAVFICPAPEDHKEVREHALEPLRDDARAIITAQTKARLARLFDEWTASI